MEYLKDDGTVEFLVTKGWKCKNGLFNVNPQDKSVYECEDCDECDIQKGIFIEDEKSFRFVSEKDINKILGGKMERKKEEIQAEIEETRQIIDDFAAHDLYSANCEEVKYLYKRLHQLEAELENVEYEEPEEEDYTPQFIGGSDVPIGGYYE